MGKMGSVPNYHQTLHRSGHIYTLFESSCSLSSPMLRHSSFYPSFLLNVLIIFSSFLRVALPVFPAVPFRCSCPLYVKVFLSSLTFSFRCSTSLLCSSFSYSRVDLSFPSLLRIYLSYRIVLKLFASICECSLFLSLSLSSLSRASA